jgi:intein-encoded DNA endonuclease-like protein
MEENREFRKHSWEDYLEAIRLNKEEGLGSQRIDKTLGIKSRNTVEGWINKGLQPYYFSSKRIAWSNSKENKKRIRELNMKSQPLAVKVSARLRTKKLRDEAKVISKELGYILGVCYGDGHISIEQRRVMLSATDKEFVEEFSTMLTRWCGFKVRSKKRVLKKTSYIKKRKVQYLSYIDSKEASLFLKQFSLNNILTSSEEVRFYFVRGFYDSEGSVDKNGRILAYNTEREILELISKIFEKSKIESLIKKYKIKNSLSRAKYMYVLVINGLENKRKYYNHISFTILRKQEKLKEYLLSKERK